MFSVPDWATALLASAIGGVVVALLQARHARVTGIRDRMLAAADDFSTGLAQAILQARTLATLTDAALNVGGTSAAEVSRALQEGRRLLEEAAARTARIDLLFGVGSPAAAAAQRAVAAIRAYIADWNEWPPRDDATWRALFDAEEYHYDFSSRARTAIERYGGLRSWLKA